MENNNKKFHYIIISVLALVFVATITISSYAYFTATVTGTSNNNVVTTGTMEIEFSDGPQVGLDNIVPGSFVEKTFSIRNTGTVDTYYDIYMSDLINDFADKTDLVYTLTSSNGENISETQVPDENTKIVQNQALTVGQTHNYTLRIDFKETNDNQDDNKGKTFSTVIRVNEVKELETLIHKVTSLADGADPTSTDVIGNTNLAYDGTTDNNLRYVGSNPNNYVKFNNELWRIIGVMNNVETKSDGTQNLVKIIRNKEFDNSYSYDTSENSINDGFGINQWGESTYEDGTPYEGADLMRELNYDYLGDVQVGTDGKWYSERDNEKNTMPPSTIGSNEQNKIESVVWHLGSPTTKDDAFDNTWEDILTPYISYTRERANTHGKTCAFSEDCNDTVIRTSKWTGKVALMYPSDYGYATSGGSTVDRQTCLNTSMRLWYNSFNDCSANNWNYRAQFMDTLSPSSRDAHDFILVTVGSIQDDNPTAIGHVLVRESWVFPSLYLKSSVLVIGGDGTQNNPYIIAN